MAGKIQAVGALSGGEPLRTPRPRLCRLRAPQAGAPCAELRRAKQREAEADLREAETVVRACLGLCPSSNAAPAQELGQASTSTGPVWEGPA